MRAALGEHRIGKIVRVHIRKSWIIGTACMSVAMLHSVVWSRESLEALAVFAVAFVAGSCYSLIVLMNDGVGG